MGEERRSETCRSRRRQTSLSWLTHARRRVHDGSEEALEVESGCSGSPRSSRRGGDLAGSIARLRDNGRDGRRE